MEINRTNLHLTYKIEEKPEGGFIARSDDPSVESLEAPTREELMEKLREKTTALLGKDLPFDLSAIENLSAAGQQIHIDRKVSFNMKPANKLPDGSFDLSSGEPLVNQSSSLGFNIWKVLFFLLLAAGLAFFWLRRR